MKSFSFSQWLEDAGSSGMKTFSVGQSYNRIAWVYACVNIIASTAASAPLAFYKGEAIPKNRITDPNHPVNQLFTTPKEPEIPSLRALLRTTFSYLGITGQVWWVFERKRGQLVTIEPKPDLTPIFAKDNKTLIGWKYTDSSGKVTNYTLEQVLPILYFNPGDAYSGLSPLSAARLSVETEFNIAGWNSSFFKTGMKNPLLIQSKGTLTKEQKQEIKKEIINYYSGIEGGHGAVLLQGNIEVTPLTVGQKDVDFVMGKKLSREEICSIYGVPPAVVGIFEYSNYANTKEQRKIFWENTLLPKMDQIADLIQVNVLNKEFPGLVCKWDTSQILGLRPEAKDVADAAKKYAEMGYSPSQIAIILNVPELDQEISLGTTALAPETSEEPNVTNVPDAVPATPQEEALFNSKDFTSFNRWSKNYGKLDRLTVEPIVESTAKRIEDFITHLSVVKSKSIKIDEQKWINLWEDTVGRELRKAGYNGMESAIIALKAVQDQGKITEIKSISKMIPFEVSNKIKESIEKSVIESFEVAKQLINSTNSLVKNIKELVFNLAKNLVYTIRENIKFKTLANMNVTKISWVAGDEQHSCMHGQTRSVEDMVFPILFNSHPRAKGMSLGDVHECFCTIVPMEFVKI
jgi:HK97 family phage portal protein